MKPVSVESRLLGPLRTRFWQEFFGNSAHFPLINLLYEVLNEGADYLGSFDLYALFIGAAVQSYWLAYWQTQDRSHRFWGNLIGPAIYSLVETSIEGWSFFASANHLAYWVFSLAIGGLQEFKHSVPHRFAVLLTVTENILRTAIIFVMYFLFETNAYPQQILASVNGFFDDPSHRFVALAVFFLGLIVGLANWNAEQYLNLLKGTSRQLYTYSQWLLGRDLLEKSFEDASVFNLSQRERAILFVDIRGFTQWSETQPPSQVAELLNRYYQLAETVVSRHAAVKFKLSADEIMAVFAQTDSAVQAALEIQQQASQLLARAGLGVGIGLHHGSVVEGILGSTGVGFYDVIGDTVNTAKRIESFAQAGEILISEPVRHTLLPHIAINGYREINAKGKSASLGVYSLTSRATV